MTAPNEPSEFDRLVSSIMAATNVSRERAIEVAKLNRPDLMTEAGATMAKIERDARIREREEQAFISDMARGYGFTVRNLSQYRPSKVATGIGDLILVHRARGIGLWWETKRQVGGVQSEDQREFEADCRLVGWTYRIGDRFDFARYLLNLGLAEEGAGSCGIVPARPLVYYCRRCDKDLSSAEEANAHGAAGHVVDRPKIRIDLVLADRPE